MLTKFKVENFKSIHSLELELGRVNVFIGENGSGKSNVLEAVALGYGSMNSKMETESLVTRGIRVTSPELMISRFEKNSDPDHLEWVSMTFEYPTKVLEVHLAATGDPSNPWVKENSFDKDPEFRQLLLEKVPNEGFTWEYVDRFSNLFMQYRKKLEAFLGEFPIYCPENSALRDFDSPIALHPIGIHGEGLFKLLKKFSEEPNQPAIRELNHHLQLFGWFDSFALPERLWPGESFLKIKDKYLDANIEFLDQRSANEGFLFVLFYLSLFISKDTPKFFAIDNIENALNPKLCTKLMTTLAELAKTHDKQVMITTHSPAVLDGMDLNEEDQRLFVVYRNAHGYTVAKRVRKPQPLPGQEPAKLSELFMRGHLGGMPTNFSL